MDSSSGEVAEWCAPPSRHTQTRPSARGPKTEATANSTEPTGTPRGGGGGGSNDATEEARKALLVVRGTDGGRCSRAWQRESPEFPANIPTVTSSEQTVVLDPPRGIETELWTPWCRQQGFLEPWTIKARPADIGPCQQLFARHLCHPFTARARAHHVFFMFFQAGLGQACVH